MSRSLIVTGDDFGSRPGANAAIVAAFGEGVLTSASLLVTGAAIDEAVELARNRPQLSTGLHLALCDAEPASPPHAIPDLVDGSDRFPARPGPSGISHWIWSRRRGPQLEREIRAQIERYLETGLPLDHVDGHHHLHMHPVIFDILQRCLSEYKVPWVRLVQEDRAARRGGEPPLGELVAGVFGILAVRHRRVLARAGNARGPDRVYGLRATGRLDLAEWLRLLPRLQGAAVEIYAHPDVATVAGRRELFALRAPELRSAIGAAGYRLVGTRQLAHAAASEPA